MSDRHDANPLGLDADSNAYYRQIGADTFMPTLHTQGAWKVDEQHMAPVSGLLTHCLETFNPRPDMTMSRISFDILGMIPAAPSTIECRTIRPGRTIELDEAVMTVDGRPVVRARAWRLAEQDTTRYAGGLPEALPDPEAFPSWGSTLLWPGGYIASLESRRDPASVPGSSRVWLRSRYDLVEDTEASALASFVGLVDTANGIAVRIDPRELMFPNLDLTIHLYRNPAPGWVGFDTHVVFGDAGVGLTTTQLHDERGPVGRAEQILTVREFPPSA